MFLKILICTNCPSSRKKEKSTKDRDRSRKKVYLINMLKTILHRESKLSIFKTSTSTMIKTSEWIFSLNLNPSTTKKSQNQFLRATNSKKEEEFRLSSDYFLHRIYKSQLDHNH